GGARGRDLLVRFLHRLRPAAIVVSQFVRRKITPRQPRARFEPDHLEPGLRERQRGDPSNCTKTDDDDVGVFQPGRHTPTPLPCAGFGATGSAPSLWLTPRRRMPTCGST